MIQHDTLPDIRDYLSPADVVPREPVAAPDLQPGQAATVRESVLRPDGVEIVEVQAMFLGSCDD